MGFVLVLTFLFLFVMFMSSKSQGLDKFEESFFQKNLLIENFNRLRIKMGDHVINHVLVGEDRWMEFSGGNNLDDYQNILSFSADDLEAVATAIQGCYRYAQEQNITFLIVVAPNKVSIYPDKLPGQLKPLSRLSRLDQLNEYLRTHNIPEVLDLRPALRDARQQHDVYYKFGTHWNEYGAHVAYERIIDVLSKSHPNLVPYSAKFFFRHSIYLEIQR
jgi:hypothetical protein